MTVFVSSTIESLRLTSRSKQKEQYQQWPVGGAINKNRTSGIFKILLQVDSQASLSKARTKVPHASLSPELLMTFSTFLPPMDEVFLLLSVNPSHPFLGGSWAASGPHSPHSALSKICTSPSLLCLSPPLHERLITRSLEKIALRRLPTFPTCCKPSSFLCSHTAGKRNIDNKYIY